MAAETTGQVLPDGDDAGTLAGYDVPSALECPICLERHRPNETALLVCGHTVHRECAQLEAQRGTDAAVGGWALTCPLCLSVTPPPLALVALSTPTVLDRPHGPPTLEAFLQLLPSNPFLEANLRPPKEPRSCSVCASEGVPADEAPATVHCPDCGADLCDIHETLHGRRPATRAHRTERLAAVLPPLSPQAAVELCPQHQEPLKAICEPCQAVVCLVCGLQAHVGAGHRTVLLTVHLAELEAGLRAAREHALERRETLTQQLALLSERIEQAPKRASSVKTELQEWFDAFRRLAFERETKLAAEIDALVNDEVTALREEHACEQRRWVALTGGLSLADGLLSATATMADVGRLARNTIVQLHSVASQVAQLAAPTSMGIQLSFAEPPDRLVGTVGCVQAAQAFAPRCVASGPGLRRASVRYAAEVVLATYDRHGAPVTGGQDRVQLRMGPLAAPGSGLPWQLATVNVDTSVAFSNPGRAEESLAGQFTVTYTAPTPGHWHLHVLVNGRPVSGSPFRVHVSSGRWLVPNTLPSASALYDDGGVLHYLATAGGTQPWRNPHATGVVAVTASSVKSEHGVQAFVGNQPGLFFTDNQPNSWVAVNLKGRRVRPTAYVLSDNRGSRAGHFLRSWQLQASEDGTTWSVLATHQHEAVFDADRASFRWSLPLMEPRENVEGGMGDAAQTEPPFAAGWAHFRIFMTGPNSDHQHYLVCSGLELYGELLDA